MHLVNNIGGIIKMLQFLYRGSCPTLLAIPVYCLEVVHKVNDEEYLQAS